MKISNITLNRYANIQKLNTKNDLHNSVSSNPLFENKSDVLEISFKSKPEGPSTLFLNAINEEEIQKEIIEKVIKDSNGNYRPEIEKAFLGIYATLLKEYLDQGNEFSTEICRTILKGTIIAFNAIREEDDSYKFEGNNIVYLAMAASDAIESNISGIEEILSVSKEKDGTIDNNLVDVILMTRGMNPDLSTDEIIHCISRYFTDENNLVDPKNIPIIMNYFNVARAQSTIERDMFFNLISDGELEIFNPDKCDFACGAIDTLYGLITKEASPLTPNITRADLLNLVYTIVCKLIDVNIEQNGKFDLEKAQASFEDWVNSAKKATYLYKQEGKEKIPLTQEPMYLSDGKKHFVNSTPYKLFKLLYS